MSPTRNELLCGLLFAVASILGAGTAKTRLVRLRHTSRILLRPLQRVRIPVHHAKKICIDNCSRSCGATRSR